MAEAGTKIDYKVGTMIEIPRAALTADEIAEGGRVLLLRHQRPHADDLTASRRDDAGKFLAAYYDKKIYGERPVRQAGSEGRRPAWCRWPHKLGRKTRPDIKLGICGEHGGDPSSVEFCHKVGLNYVSCSPFRVPIARLAAAHAAIKEKMGQL